MKKKTLSLGTSIALLVLCLLFMFCCAPHHIHEDELPPVLASSVDSFPCLINTYTEAEDIFTDTIGPFKAFNTNPYQGDINALDMGTEDYCVATKARMWNSYWVSIWLHGENNTYHLVGIYPPVTGNGLNDANNVCLHLDEIYTFVSCTAVEITLKMCSMYPITLNSTGGGGICQINLEDNEYVAFVPAYDYACPCTAPNFFCQ